MDGTSINCYVVEADSTAPEFVDSATTSPRTLWIDKSRFVVLRESYTMKLKEGTLGGPTEIRHATDFKVASVNEFVADTLFVFTPPEGATQVEDLGGSKNEGGARARRKKPLN
jgi:outer membrane lipoprotein-sorting protein